MKVKYVILLVLFVLVLAASEYIFLSELYGTARTAVLLFTTFLAAASVVAIFLCYRRIAGDI